MVQMNVSVPEKLKSWAERRVAEGDYASTSDYVRDLIRRDRERAEHRDWLQAEIDEGLASPTLDEDALMVIDAVIAQGPSRRDAA